MMGWQALIGAVWPRAEVKRLRAELQERAQLHQLATDRVIKLEAELERLRRNFEESQETALFCLQQQINWYARRAGGPTVYGDFHPDDPQAAVVEQRVGRKLPGRVAVKEHNREFLGALREQIRAEADRQEAEAGSNRT